MNDGRDIRDRVRDGARLDRAMVLARRRVIRLHRHLGVPLVVWRDGQVVELLPDSAELEETLRDGAPGMS